MPSPSVPTLPLELLLSILSHLLLPTFVPTSLTTLFPSTQLSGTTSILLTSKPLRSLALPLFWRMVTISKLRHWEDLFALPGGLLVSKTEEGRERRGWVREMLIVVGGRSGEGGRGGGAFWEDGTFGGMRFLMGEGMERLRGCIERLTLVGLQELGKEVDQKGDDASSSSPVAGASSAVDVHKDPHSNSGSSVNLTHPFRTILLGQHLGASIQFVLRAVQPRMFDLPLADWSVVEDKGGTAYTKEIEVVLRKGTSSMGAVGAEGELGREARETVVRRLEERFGRGTGRVVGFEDGEEQEGEVCRGGRRKESTVGLREMI